MAKLNKTQLLEAMRDLRRKGGLSDSDLRTLIQSLWRDPASNVYIAFASDDQGTDFSLVNDPDLAYMAILISPIKIPNPVVADFEGLWRSGGSGQPDWSQTDNTKPDYIKNRAKQYTAFVSQTGTNAPTAIVLENTIGTIVFTRTATGTYRLTLTGAFTADKTSPIDDTMMDQAGNLFTLNRIDANYLELKTYAYTNITQLADGVLNKRYINITVFL